MEKLTPASPRGQKPMRELSTQEFQLVLSDWFQQTGISQDIKSYIKFHMVKALENTSIGKEMKKKVFQTQSLAQQAVHLIVGEYLLYYDCHFAFSLFSSEMGLPQLLIQTKLFVDNDERKERIRLSKDSLVNILELIGVPRRSDNFDKIVQMYVNENQTPLLMCLLNILAKSSSDMKPDELSIRDGEEDVHFLKQTQEILQSQNLPRRVQFQLLYKLKQCLNSKIKQYEEQVGKLITKFKASLNKKKDIIHELEKTRNELQNRIDQLIKENEIFKNQIDNLQKTSCNLKHCSEMCRSDDLFQKQKLEKLKDFIESIVDCNDEKSTSLITSSSSSTHHEYLLDDAKKSLQRLDEENLEIERKISLVQCKYNLVQNSKQN